MIYLRPVTRRIVYVAFFEAFAILLSTLLLMLLSGGDAQESLPVAVAVSVIAVVWNYIFNSVFEWWESTRNYPERTVAIRIAHASLFELGLMLLTIPLYMWWYQVGPLRALVMEATILIFFLFYTFIFTWGFDLVFALPERQEEQALES